MCLFVFYFFIYNHWVCLDKVCLFCSDIYSFFGMLYMFYAFILIFSAPSQVQKEAQPTALTPSTRPWGQFVFFCFAFFFFI